MSMMKRAAAVAVALGLVATNAVTFAASAEARDNGWRRHSNSRPHVGHVYGRQHVVPQYYGRDYGHRRDRSGDAIGAAVLGIGALIIGAAIADSARKARRYHDED